MAGIDYIERIPNNVNLHENRRLQRALEDWQPKFLEWWQDMGPERLPGQGGLPPHRHQRGRAGLGPVRLRQDARLPLGHLPRRARAGPPGQLRRPQGPARVAGGAGRVPRHAPPSHRHPGRHRARVGRAAAPPRPHLPVALRPPQPLPGQRRGGPAPLGHGLPARRALRPRRARGVGGAAPAPLGRRATSRASSAPSTRRPRTGCPSSCSASSPTATASTSWRAWRRAASTRSPGPAASC